MKSAIRHLLQLRETDRLEMIAEGIGHIVENMKRLDDAARVLHAAKQWQTSGILTGFAKEEAAKVLILLDVVRCPPSRPKDLSRTLGYFDNHLPKRIYAESCNFPWMTSFKELRERVEFLRKDHYLGGPQDVDWIFPNDVKASRERDIYVDYIEDITDENGEHIWMTPYELPGSDYLEAGAIAVVRALFRLGAGSRSGLNVVKEEWQDFRPELGDSFPDYRRRVAETLDRLSDGPDEPETRSAANVVWGKWPFPMWSLDLSTVIKVDLEELRRTRKEEIGRLEQVASVREPALTVTESLVEELARDYRAAEAEIESLEELWAGPSKSRIRTVTVGYDDSPLFLALKKKLQKFTEEERADLAALAWLTRDRVTDWAYCRAHAAKMIKHMTYTAQAGLGKDWREGYRRWNSEPKEFVAGGRM